MRSSGVEDLKAALRRSIWLIVALTVAGAVIMTVVKQVDGARYRATSKVVLSRSDLAASLAGIQPVYVDPSRQDEAEHNLASSPPLYVRAATATGGRYGSAAEMRSATAVGGSNNIVSFAATTTTPGDSIGIANALARTYPGWRADVYAKAIDAAIRQIRAQLRGGGAGSSALTDQLQRLNVLKTVNSGDTLLVEPADGAVKTTPKPLRDAVLGGVIGLVVAFLLTGLRELLDTRVRSEADVEEALGVPVLATVQSIPKRAQSELRSMGDSRFADTYELLAANLAQILEGREKPAYLAITSAEPGEGKTTTAANLSVALARRGASVVLADFDLRKPAISSYFSIPADATGVTEILRGAAGVRSALWPVSLRSSVPATADRTGARSVKVREPRVDPDGSLVILPAGRPSSNGTGAQFSRLPKLLATLEPDADYVIIDTPPALLTAGVAELSQSLNAVLVVVRQGFATRRRLKALGSRAHTWQPKMVGAVLNDVVREGGYRHYYYGRP